MTGMPAKIGAEEMQIKFPAGALLLWANAKAAEMLVRSTPVQSTSKWKKK
jgi:hypothetical protein